MPKTGSAIAKQLNVLKRSTYTLPSQNSYKRKLIEPNCCARVQTRFHRLKHRIMFFGFYTQKRSSICNLLGAFIPRRRLNNACEQEL